MIAGLSITTLLTILLAGIGAGFVGYAVGASSLVSYPALLALGIAPVLANATNTVGVIGTGIGGVIGARRELRGQFTRVAVYAAIGAAGGVAGAALLLGLDPSVFEFLAPVLILLSSVVIAVNPKGRIESRQAVHAAQNQLAAVGIDDPETGGASSPKARLGSLGEDRIVQPMSQDSWWVWIGVVAVAVYSGYFGAGAGTCALAVLDAAKIGPFHKINAFKTIIGTGANITASAVFIVRGVVNWPAAIVLCLGCFIGGYIAVPVTRRIPAHVMRAAAVVAGVVLAVDLGMKSY